MAEIYDKPVEPMRSEMDALAAQGQVEKRPVRGGEFWALPATHTMSGAATAVGVV